MFVSKIVSFIIMLIISACAAYLYSRFKGYKFIGNIYGGIIVAFLGAILFDFILNPVDKYISENFNINFLAVLLGAVVFVKILNKVTPR